MKKLVHTFVLFFFFIVFAFTETHSLVEEPLSSDRAVASQEFRRGVQSYFRGQFNESILLFEKALSYLPGESLIMDWLGKAYYRSGIEGAALKQWEFAVESGYGGILLKSKIETLKDRRSITSYSERLLFDKYSQQISLDGVVNGQTVFLQPTSVSAMKDGSFWVSDFGANELIHFDANGLVIKRTNGPINGFSRPFDILELNDGRLLVSEFASDKISFLDNNGKYIKSFGTKGIGNGQLVGPLYLAEDEFGNIYVSDFGNARIAVFSPDGDPLFEFGEKNSVFDGFIDPTGIAIIDGLVYIADGIRGAIFIFDTAGNYQGELLPPGSLKCIYSMKIWQNNLVITNMSEVYSVDISTGAIRSVVSLGNTPSRIVSAVPDANNNLLLVDYKNEKIEIASAIRELAGGVFVTVDRIISNDFPKVVMDVRVQNRNGNPIFGLNGDNFFVTEKNRPISDFQVLGAGHLSEMIDVTILIERSPESLEDLELIHRACSEIVAAMNGKGSIRIVTASKNPLLEASYSPKSYVSNSKLKNPIAQDWRFDLALRLSAGELLTVSPKRAVIFLNSGGNLSNGFTTYGLNDLAAFMNNNGIKFYSINLHKKPVFPEIKYLVDKTGGKMSYVYAEKGLSPIVEDILSSSNGLYRMEYKSTQFSDFGRSFLPVEVEVRVLTRSGRDEIGYFAPLE